MCVYVCLCARAHACTHVCQGRGLLAAILLKVALDTPGMGGTKSLGASSLGRSSQFQANKKRFPHISHGPVANVELT